MWDRGNVGVRRRQAEKKIQEIDMQGKKGIQGNG